MSEIARRFVVLHAFLLWQGGFVVYGGVVVPVGAEVLGSDRLQGFVTQQVTGWLNLFGVAWCAALAWDCYAVRGDRLRGVTVAVTSVFIAYHQKCLSTFKSGLVRRAISQQLGAWISRWLCRHNHTSPNSRKYQPLATMPCSCGKVPVSIEVCAVVVTAGTTPVIGVVKPSLASRERFGVSLPKWADVRPTQSMRTRGFKDGSGSQKSPVLKNPKRRFHHDLVARLIATFNAANDLRLDAAIAGSSQACIDRVRRDDRL